MNMIVGAAASLVIHYLYDLTQVHPLVLDLYKYGAEKTAAVLTLLPVRQRDMIESRQHCG